MCAMLIGVPAGNPARLTMNVAVPPVTLPDASRVTLNVTVAVPLPDCSALLIGGFSLEGLSSAVKVGMTALGAVDELPHAADPIAITIANKVKRFIIGAPSVIKRICV